MPIFLQDVRIAIRTLRKAPAFALGAALVLALAIGATTAIFSLVDAALLRPLPFRDAGRLVRLFERSPQTPRSQVAFSDFEDWRDQSHSFAGFAGAMVGGQTSLTDGSGAAADSVVTQSVTPGFFEVLGVAPVAGRTFAPSDKASPVTVISDRLWRTRFNANPSLVGGSIRVGGIPRTVIGIVPAGFELLTKADVWTPPPSTLMTPSRRVHFLDVIARLAPGITIDQARADVGLIADNIARIAPETNKGWNVTIEPLQRSIVSDELRRTALALGTGVLFVLLMACANVANLLLARGVDRTRELAVRAAIGGSPARLVRQMLTESLLLAVIGGTGGIALAWAIVRAAPALIPPRTIPPGIVLALDWRLVAFAVGLTFATSLASGCAPAWQATRVSLVEAMGAGTRAAVGRGGRLRAAFAVLQVATALLLVAGAGLFVRTIVSLNRVDGGFRGERLLTMSVSLPLNRYATADRWQRFYDDVTTDAANLPGVRGASFVCCDVPLDGFGLGQSFEVVGETSHDPANLPIAHLQLAGPRYFETMSIPVRAGRTFEETDNRASAPVCIVNEEFVRRYIHGRSPIGASVNVTPLTLRPTPPIARTIVGVVGQVKRTPGDVEPGIEIYLPFAQNAWFSGSFVVRAAMEDPTALTPAIKAIVAGKDQDIAVTRVRTMDAVAAEATASPRFRAQLVAAFAALAIVLAGVGLLSVLSYSVRQRKQEFGVRVALGARPSDVLRIVLAEGAVLAALGLTVGLVSAVVLLRFVTSLLFGVTPLDPLTLATAAAVVAALTIAACAAPAIRAIRTDPALMLRQA